MVTTSFVTKQSTNRLLFWVNSSKNIFGPTIGNHLSDHIQLLTKFDYVRLILILRTEFLRPDLLEKKTAEAEPVYSG